MGRTEKRTTGGGEHKGKSLGEQFGLDSSCCTGIGFRPLKRAIHPFFELWQEILRTATWWQGSWIISYSHPQTCTYAGSQFWMEWGPCSFLMSQDLSALWMVLGGGLTKNVRAQSTCWCLDPCSWWFTSRSSWSKEDSYSCLLVLFLFLICILHASPTHPTHINGAFC